jgi:hypothetical protein
VFCKGNKEKSQIFLVFGQYYEQSDVVAMGFPVSRIIADFFMEHFEEMALEGLRRSPSAGFATWLSGHMVQASCRIPWPSSQYP